MVTDIYLFIYPFTYLLTSYLIELSLTLNRKPLTRTPCLAILIVGLIDVLLSSVNDTVSAAEVILSKQSLYLF